MLAGVTGLAAGLLVVFGVAALADWVAVATERKPLELVAKPAALAALVGVAAAVDAADPGVRAWFLVALVASLAGDVLLMLPSDRFVAGLAAFLVAHLAYVGGLLAAGVTATALVVGVVIVGVAVVAIGRPLLRGVRLQAPDMALPVIAYMGVISAMVVGAIGTGEPLAVAGAGLFYASDAMIGLTRFVRPAAGAPVAIMVTYHLGQLLLTLFLV